MQSPASDTTLTMQGITALNAGDKARALELFTHALLENPADARAWLWLSGAVESAAERRFCLEQASRIDPHNIVTLRGLALLPQDVLPKSPLLRYVDSQQQQESRPASSASLSSNMDPPNTSALRMLHATGDESANIEPAKLAPMPTKQLRVEKQSGKKSWWLLLAVCIIVAGIAYLEFFTNTINLRSAAGIIHNSSPQEAIIGKWSLLLRSNQDISISNIEFFRDGTVNIGAESVADSNTLVCTYVFLDDKNIKIQLPPSRAAIELAMVDWAANFTAVLRYGWFPNWTQVVRCIRC